MSVVHSNCDTTWDCIQIFTGGSSSCGKWACLDHEYYQSDSISAFFEPGLQVVHKLMKHEIIMELLFLYQIEHTSHIFRIKSTGVFFARFYRYLSYFLVWCLNTLVVTACLLFIIKFPFAGVTQRHFMMRIFEKQQTWLYFCCFDICKY